MMRRFFPSTIRQLGGDIPIADAVGLFSFRKVNPSYSGFCCRIWRVSDSTTLDVGFVSDYVDESAINTFCTGTTGLVNIWYDQSGNDNNFENLSPSSTNQPIIYQSGAIIKTNGKVALLLSTLSHTLILVSREVMRSSFSVVKINTLHTVNYFLYDNIAPAGLFAGGTATGVNGMGVFRGGGSFSNNLENTNQNLQTYIGTPTKKVYTNGANEAIDSGVTADIFVQRIQRNQSNLFLNGTIQESLIYTVDNDSIRTTIEDDINAYYGIY